VVAARAGDCKFFRLRFKRKFPLFSLLPCFLAIFLFSGGIHAIVYGAWLDFALAFSGYTESFIGLLLMWNSATANVRPRQFIAGLFVFILGSLSIPLMLLMENLNI
jgi:uncharacterized membrane protein YjjP (DUF1212 family)